MGKYLNEENYQKGKSKLKLIATIIAIVGAALFVLLLTIGIVRVTNQDKVDYDAQIATLKSEIEVLEQQRDAEFEENGMSPEYKALGRQIWDKQEKITSLELDKFDAEGINGEAVGAFVGAVMVLFFFGAGTGVLFFIAHSREIVAFTTQQVMPVAKEGIEEMAPTIGTLSKEISKGIAEGKSEAQNQKND